VSSAAKRTRAAAAFAIGALALVLLVWIRWERRGGPSPESDLDLPALFSPLRQRSSHSISAEPGVPVLCYHYFRPGLNAERMMRVLGAVLLNLPTLPDKDFWSVTAPEFERQMRYLRDAGYHAATMDELVAHVEGRALLPERSVVITIDDGDESVASIAAPILARYGQRATLFMLTGFAGVRGWNEIDFLDWEGLRRLDRSGVVRVESHTHRMHTKVRVKGTAVPRFLLECRDETGRVSAASPLGRDLRASRESIEQQLGREGLFLSWPFGFGDPATDSLAASIGYRGIFTLQPARSAAAQDSSRHDPRRTLGRFPVTARTTFPEFRRLVASSG
jgi:peptidoglycan/xylan/chitin deacetylase (PgdA/CDA1 family)